MLQTQLNVAMASIIILLSCFPMTMISVFIKVKRDIVSDNVLFVDSLLTIYPAAEHLCVSQCEKLTEKSTNLVKYNRRSGTCHCFLVSHKFRDTRDFAPQLESVTEVFIKCERRLNELRKVSFSSFFLIFFLMFLADVFEPNEKS